MVNVDDYMLYLIPQQSYQLFYLLKKCVFLLPNDTDTEMILT